MRILAVLSLLGVLAATAFLSAGGARTASAQTPPFTTITVLKTCTGVPDPDAQFRMILQFNGANATNVVDATIEVECGQPAIFTFLDGQPADQNDTFDVVEQVLSGNVESTDVSDCQDIQAVRGENVGCTVFNELGEDNRIVVVKDAGGANANFGFSITASGGSFPCEDSSFTLNDQNSASDDEAFDGCLAGITYVITEVGGPNGWSLVDVDCDDDGDVTYGQTSNGRTVRFNEYGVQVICTFYNERVEELGSITVRKSVPGTDPQDFTFNDNVPACSFGPLDDDPNSATPRDATCGNLENGVYTIVENVPPGWDLVEVQCSAGTDVTQVTNGVTIELEEGEDTLCEFFNEREDGRGSITIAKETDPDTNGVFFDFDGDFGDFDLEDDGSITFSNLNPGTYSVTENEPSGWNLTDIICNGVDIAFSANTVHIDLDAGEHVTCEFVNQRVSGPLATPTKTPIVVIPAATATPTKTPAPPVVGPIAPPSAGDGGLLTGDGLPWVFGVMSIVFASGTAWVFIQHRMRRTPRD